MNFSEISISTYLLGLIGQGQLRTFSSCCDLSQRFWHGCTKQAWASLSKIFLLTLLSIFQKNNSVLKEKSNFLKIAYFLMFYVFHWNKNQTYFAFVFIYNAWVGGHCKCVCFTDIPSVLTKVILSRKAIK